MQEMREGQNDERMQNETPTLGTVETVNLT